MEEALQLAAGLSCRLLQNEEHPLHVIHLVGGPTCAPNSEILISLCVREFFSTVIGPVYNGEHCDRSAGLDPRASPPTKSRAPVQRRAAETDSKPILTWNEHVTRDAMMRETPRPSVLCPVVCGQTDATWYSTVPVTILWGTHTKISCNL